jgi:carbon-monoxide dehydrogenase medium subunit
MHYCEPGSIAEAVALLAEDDGAKCLGGGATLIAMLNAGLIEPSRIVSLRRIPELCGIVLKPDGDVLIGAMTTHAAVAAEPKLFDGLALVRDAAAQIAHPPIRNMGTIGGALAHADPSADYPCALVAAGGEVEAEGPRGRRTWPIEAFFVDYLTSALAPDEVVVGVHVPGAMRGEASAYVRFARVDGDYATVSVGVRLRWEAGACAAIRIAVGSCGPTPIRLEAAERQLVGTGLQPAIIANVAQAYVAASDPMDDIRGSADYRRMLIPGLLERAVRRACDRLQPDTARGERPRGERPRGERPRGDEP